MFRFKTLLGRLSATYICIVLFTMLLLGITVTYFLRWRAVDECQERLVRLATTISDLFEDSLLAMEAGDDMAQNVEELISYEECAVVVVDKYDVTYLDLLHSSGIDEYSRHLEENRENMLEVVLQGQTVYHVSYEENFFATPIVTLGAPLMVEDQAIGAIFLYKEVSQLSGSLGMLYTQLLVVGCVAIFFGFLLIYYTTRKIEQPLLAINQAAKELAKGNFKQRIAGVAEENEVGQLVDTFNVMAEELEKYENTQQSFVANVSHELRSPLTSIQGFVQGMLDGAIEEADQKQYLEIVLSETKRLNILISDLLDLAKFESGQFPLHISKWDVNELCRQCVIRFITKIEDKKLDMVVNVPEGRTMVEADKDRITQVLTNLIDNAVKFCDPGGTLKLWTLEADGKVRVSVSNTGEVIPEEDLPFVFERFYKVDKSHNRKSPGTGIGLSIVRNILLQHGEGIWVNSKEGQGTVFSFTLPLATEQKEKKPRGRDKGEKPEG